MDKHLTWVKEILWVRDWLIANDWLEDHVKVEFAADRPSSYYGFSEIINLNLNEVEDEEKFSDLENIHIQVFLHEVGHHLHNQAIDLETFNVLREIYLQGLKVVNRIGEQKTQLELYQKLPLEAEAEMAREELYKQIKQAGVI